MNKRLIIDINSIIPFLRNGKVTGIGRTTFQLITELAKLNDILPFTIVLFSQNMRGVSGGKMNSPFDSKHFFLPHRESINKFFAFVPLKEIFLNYDFMHVPHNFEYVFQPDKTLFTLHDALFMKISEKSFDHLKMRKEVPKLMHKCKGIITCSQASKKDIAETMSLVPDKIDVIYWGIDHIVFHPIEDKAKVAWLIIDNFNINSPYFLSVSCSSERKNTDKLVLSYIQLLKNSPLNDLVLIWPDPPDFVKLMVQKSGLGNRVHFLANLSDEQLVLLYNGATALFFPSSYEGFGLPVLEAMACGTPVVTCRNSSLPEVGGEAALYMDDPNPENILNYLERFENNEFDRNSISLKGIKQASKFDWTKTAGEYINVYKKYLEFEN